MIEFSAFINFIFAVSIISKLWDNIFLHSNFNIPTCSASNSSNFPLFIFNVFDIKLSVFISFELNISTCNVFVFIWSVNISFDSNLSFFKFIIFASIAFILSLFKILFKIESLDKIGNFKSFIFKFFTSKFLIELSITLNLSKFISFLKFNSLSFTHNKPSCNFGNPNTSHNSILLSNAFILQPSSFIQNILLPLLSLTTK